MDKSKGKKSLNNRFSAISDEQREKDRDVKKDEKNNLLEAQLEKDNNHKKGSSKFAKPFLFSGILFFIVGMVLALKS